MSARALLAIVAVTLLGGGHVVADDRSSIWTVAMVDPFGDAKGAGPDAAQLSYRYDRAAGMLWLRIAMYGPVDAKALTVRTTTDVGSVTGPQGVIADSEAAVVGVKLAPSDPPRINIAVSVGQNGEWTDDIPNAKTILLDLAAPRPERGLREIDVRRNNLQIACPCLRDHDLPSVTRRGRRGGRPIILVPGVFSGPATFDRFIARHANDYRFLMVTPPGLNGTRPRPAPDTGVSYGERPWTRRLERDIIEIIRRERLQRPLLVTHGFPGSLVATSLAADHADLIGGAIEIAAMPSQPFPSPSDPTGKTMISPADRARVNDKYWAPLWFKYVTPETWENNNYRAVMFQRDAGAAERARQQIERNALPIKVRYLTESNATDDSEIIQRVAAPLLALRPAFSQTVLDDPANRWFKASFVDAWDRFATNPHIELTTVPDSGVLVFDDQLSVTDEAIGKFLARLPK